MLIEFTVGNYLSFKDKATFSMVAADIVSKNADLDEHNIFQVDDELTLLKSAAVYGANASGKSNLVKAIRFLKDFIINSSRETQITDDINVDNFRLSEETDDRPSFFEIVFLLDSIQYRYGFEVDREKVVSEWLFYVPEKTEVNLFFRKGEQFDCADEFQEGNGIAEKTRKNALLLSVSAQFNGIISSKILLWMESGLVIVSGLEDKMLYTIANAYFKDSKERGRLVDLIKKFDIGIDDIQILEENLVSTPSELSGHKNSDEKELLGGQVKIKVIDLNLVRSFMFARIGEQPVIPVAFRKKYDSEKKLTSLEVFNLEREESEGTKKLFALIAPLLAILEESGVLVIDEFDARLHPLITRSLVQLFNSNETNPNNAQLIFMTHDTNLLSHKLLRRDQIWFTEKDRFGATDLYSLVEFNLENDTNYESDYIRGKYGAIPFIGDLKSLFGDRKNTNSEPQDD